MLDTHVFSWVKMAEIPCVVFAISKSGDFGAATTQGVFHLWSCQDGVVEVREVVASD